MTNAVGLRDLPRELLIDLLCRSQVTTRVSGTMYEQEMTAIVDGVVRKQTVRLCMICGEKGKCQRACPLCKVTTCVTLLNWCHVNTDVGSDYYHRDCIPKYDYKKCGVWYCSTFTKEEDADGAPLCRYCKTPWK